MTQEIANQIASAAVKAVLGSSVIQGLQEEVATLKGEVASLSNQADNLTRVVTELLGKQEKINHKQLEAAAESATQETTSETTTETPQEASGQPSPPPLAPSPPSRPNHRRMPSLTELAKQASQQREEERQAAMEEGQKIYEALIAALDADGLFIRKMGYMPDRREVHAIETAKQEIRGRMQEGESIENAIKEVIEAGIQLGWIKKKRVPPSTEASTQVGEGEHQPEAEAGQPASQNVGDIMPTSLEACLSSEGRAAMDAARAAAEARAAEKAKRETARQREQEEKEEAQQG